MTAITRTQTGVRIETRVLNVLKALCALKGMTLGDLLEGIVLHAFDGKPAFSDQTLAQIELWTNGKAYKNEVYTLPKHLDEKVALLHLEKLGAKLTKMSKEQADYIGVAPAGPFKPNHYRY